MGRDALERFWTKVEKGPECWLWKGSTNNDGYGRFNPAGKLVGAHRFAFENCVGPIPPGAFVLHKCDTPACVNPDHLFLGDQFINMQDMYAKRRHKMLGQCKNCPDKKAVSLDMCRSCYMQDWFKRHPGKQREYYERSRLAA